MHQSPLVIGDVGEQDERREDVATVYNEPTRSRAIQLPSNRDRLTQLSSTVQI